MQIRNYVQIKWRGTQTQYCIYSINNQVNHYSSNSIGCDLAHVSSYVLTTKAIIIRIKRDYLSATASYFIDGGFFEMQAMRGDVCHRVSVCLIGRKWLI